MSMFKVGDRVRESLSGVTGVVIDVSRRPGCAVVQLDDPSKGIRHEAFPGKNVYMLPSGMFERIIPADQEKPASKILITTDGKTTTAEYGDEKSAVENGKYVSFERAAQAALMQVTQRSIPKTDKPESKPEQPKQDKAEPVKLYCVKDHKPGEWVTKGKIYTFYPGGECAFDDGYTVFFDNWKKGNVGGIPWTKLLVPLVNRPAKVGERVIALKDSSFHDRPNGELRYEKDQLLKCTEIPIDLPWAGKAIVYDNTVEIIKHEDYLVLDGYQPEPEQPQYYNGKVVCVDNGDATAWEIGKVYTFENGRTVNSEGGTSPYNEDWIRSFEHLNKVFASTKFIEFKGE